jgi:hypothetical protein
MAGAVTAAPHPHAAAVDRGVLAEGVTGTQTIVALETFFERPVSVLDPPAEDQDRCAAVR